MNHRELYPRRSERSPSRTERNHEMGIPPHRPGGLSALTEYAIASDALPNTKLSFLFAATLAEGLKTVPPTRTRP